MKLLVISLLLAMPAFAHDREYCRPRCVTVVESFKVANPKKLKCTAPVTMNGVRSQDCKYKGKLWLVMPTKGD